MIIHIMMICWEVIQEEIADGWFVPSKSEWFAFGAAIWNYKWQLFKNIWT